jgi:two-component system, sensor histidine kinase PdtaS
LSTAITEATTEPPLSRWEELSTGLKMLIILSVGLLPLGILAVIASIDNVNANRARSALGPQAVLAAHVQRFTLALSRNSFTIRAARDAIIEAPNPDPICKRTLDRLVHLPGAHGRYALFGRATTPQCLTTGFAPPTPPPAHGEISRIRIAPDGDRIEFFLFDPGGNIEGIVEYRREVLAQAVTFPLLPGNFAVDLTQGDRVMALRAASLPAGPDDVTVNFPFGNGQFAMRVRTPPPTLTLTEILVILTPVMMWLWASLAGWIIVRNLLLRPLARIQNVISAYKPGDRGVDLPAVRSPAREIAALGRAFAGVTQTVARHEADLEAAVVRQTKLVREVHHRVKNNLQVVASLLNLHSRGSRNEKVAAAYASIQRRVDALAVVHRNHYAELEENRGVALKSLISELAANLRATAPPSAALMQIRLDVGAYYVTQDVAVSVAFLITEIVEFGMLRGATQVSVALDEAEEGGALLSVEVDAPPETANYDEALADRFDRIVTGLARQLRSTLERDPDRGRYALRIAVVEDPA